MMKTIASLVIATVASAVKFQTADLHTTQLAQTHATMAGFDFNTDLIPSDSYSPEEYEHLMQSFSQGLWDNKE